MGIEKNELKKMRDFVEKRAAAEAENGTKLHLEKDLLEQLLFDSHRTIASGIIAKFPVWTGPFLKNIDLSEVSFDGVVWGPVDPRYFAVDSAELETFFGDKMLGRDYPIDFSYTNANIDFSKCFALEEWNATMRHAGYGVLIQGCDFSGLDLSKSNIDKIDRVIYSNLSGTNAVLSEKGDYSHSNLSNLDLSTLTINEKTFKKNSKESYRFYDTNLDHTGVNVVFSNETTREDVLDVIRIMRRGFLNGCIINGSYLESMPDRREKTEEEMPNAGLGR